MPHLRRVPIPANPCSFYSRKSRAARAFGREVLTNPTLVTAIENEFIPVLVYNNRAGGRDQELLARFQEPAWNYQVIRFIDGAGHDVIPRKDRVWTTGGVASRMIEALTAVKRPVPQYLEDLAAGERRH